MNLRPVTEDFSPGCLTRAKHLFPLQVDHNPWRNSQNYASDKKIIRHAPLEDDVLYFSNPPAATETTDPELANVARTQSAA